MFAILIIKSNASQWQLVKEYFAPTIEMANKYLNERQYAFPQSAFKIVKLTSSMCKRYRADNNTKFPEMI